MSKKKDKKQYVAIDICNNIMVSEVGPVDQVLEDLTEHAASGQLDTDDVWVCELVSHVTEKVTVSLETPIKE